MILIFRACLVTLLLVGLALTPTTHIANDVQLSPCRLQLCPITGSILDDRSLLKLVHGGMNAIHMSASNIKDNIL